MIVKKLKEILKNVPDDAEILLAANGHYNFTDTTTHGKSVVAHITIGENDKDVFVFSATSCGFDPLKLNYRNIKIVNTFSS